MASVTFMSLGKVLSLGECTCSVYLAHYGARFDPLLYVIKSRLHNLKATLWRLHQYSLQC